MPRKDEMDPDSNSKHMNAPGNFRCSGPSLPSPITSIYENMDRGAFSGERRSAKELANLISDSETPYQEETREDRSSWSDKPRTARTDYDPLEGLSMKFNNYPEIAYWCPIEELWIQGAPSATQYDDIGPLSGSSGHRLICRSCGHNIGALVERRS